VWSNSLYGQIANAVMLTRTGDGSTAYYDDREATKIIDDYLAFRRINLLMVRRAGLWSRGGLRRFERGCES